MAGNVTAIGDERYYYDSLSRLTRASIPLNGSTHVLEFGFDAFGNMTSQTRSTTGQTTYASSRSYNVDWPTNRLLQRSWNINGTATTTSYAFDENGNMTGDGSKANVFDDQGRLREVMDPLSGRIGNYGYDASGYRVRTQADGVETFYVRDASGQVLSEYQRRDGTNDAPAWNKDYVYLLGKSFALVKNQTPAARRIWATNVTATTANAWPEIEEQR
jgi:YD repeat-containing protein